jgi:hypothetical protein
MILTLFKRIFLTLYKVSVHVVAFPAAVPLGHAEGINGILRLQPLPHGELD